MLMTLVTASPCDIYGQRHEYTSKENKLKGASETTVASVIAP